MAGEPSDPAGRVSHNECAFNNFLFIPAIPGLSEDIIEIYAYGIAAKFFTILIHGGELRHDQAGERIIGKSDNTYILRHF